MTRVNGQSPIMEKLQATDQGESKPHTVALMVVNRFGAFARIAGLFAAKGYNIDSMTVGPTEDESISRITIVTHGDDQIVEQILKQLNKLIDVIKVVDLTHDSFVDRELVLVKVHSAPQNRSEIMQIGDIFRAKVVDISGKSLTMEATGSQQKVDAFIKMLKPFQIVEMARTGRVALKREFQGEV